MKVSIILIFVAITMAYIMQSCGGGYDDYNPSYSSNETSVEPTVFQEMVNGSFSTYYDYENTGSVSWYSYLKEGDKLTLISDINVTETEQKRFWQTNPKETTLNTSIGYQEMAYPFFPGNDVEGCSCTDTIDEGHEIKQIAILYDSITNDPIAMATKVFSSLENDFIEEIQAISLKDSLIVDLTNLTTSMKIYFSLEKIKPIKTGQITTDSEFGLTYDLEAPIIDSCIVNIHDETIQHDERFILENNRLILYRGYGKISKLLQIKKNQ